MFLKNMMICVQVTLVLLVFVVFAGATLPFFPLFLFKFAPEDGGC